MPLQNVDLANAIIFSIMQGLAVLVTLFRLGFRLRIQRFWWEDAWAAVALVCIVLFIATTPAFFIHYEYDLVLITGWINACMFTSVVWSVRMSLVCSILRITTSLLMRRLLLVIATFLILFCAATFTLESWWCVGNPGTISDRNRSKCMLPGFIVIFELAINCLADFSTLALSLKFLWRVELPPRQRRMILCLFTASKFLCMFALPHSISQLVASRRVQNIFANIQLIAFVIVCNLIVVVTCVYRFFLRSPRVEFERDDEDFTTAPDIFSDTLTTVELVDLDMACESDMTSFTVASSYYLDSSGPSTQ